MIVKDSNGTPLADGDAVQPIKDLKVKGSSMVLKKGEAIKNIRLVEDNEKEVECRVQGSVLLLETQYLKKR
jgi:protein PhnA